MKKQDNEAPFEEFMRFAYKGFSWAENICQRVESLCSEDTLVQKPGKYVNVVGEHVKRMINTIVDDLRENADDVSELFSDLPLRHASLVMAFGNKGEEFDDSGTLDEKPSACQCGKGTTFMENTFLVHEVIPNVVDNLGSETEKNAFYETIFACSKLDKTFSPMEDSLSQHGDGTMFNKSLRAEIEENVSYEQYTCIKSDPEVHSVEDLNQAKLPCEEQFLNKKYVSMGIIVETPVVEVEGLNCSAPNLSDAAAFDVELTIALSDTEAVSSMTHRSILTGGTSPCYSVGILESEPQEASSGSEPACQKGHENLNSFSREDLCGDSSIFSLKAEDMNEFEDVKLENDFEAVKVENDWDDIVKDEIALISSQAAKKESCKKKLKKMLTSRWRSSRDRKLVIYQDDLHSKTSSDSDWELL